MNILIGSEAIQAKFERISGEAMPHLAAKIQKLTIRLQAAVVRDKLSGQVLKVRTNNLRSSIHQEVTTSGGKITGIVGTNVEYAAAHEYGFSDTVEVKAHMRRTKAEKIYFTRGKRKGLENELAMLKAQKKKKASISVKAHTRKVNFPERSFLRSAMADMADDTRTELSEEVGAILA